MGARRDYVSVIEAAYASLPNERAWLEQLVEEVDRRLGFGVPVVAYAVDASDPGEPRVGHAVTHGLPCEGFAMLQNLNAAYQPADVRRLYCVVPPVALASELMPSLAQHTRLRTRAFHRGLGIADVLGIRGLGLDGRGVMLCLGFTGSPTIAPRTRMALGRVARHLATAYRLRRKQRVSVDAVLSRDGRVEHAEPAFEDPRALRDLVSATRKISMARGPIRREEPEGAVELWRALVSGRWSVVETLESDGKRYLLARRNELGAKHPRALTSNEGQVLALAAAGHSNSTISYELGLSATRVSRLLRAGMAKLGVGSRAELAVYGAFGERK